MTSVLDASAVLAYVHGEDGAEVVQRAIDSGAVCSAANWSEVVHKVGPADWSLVRSLLDGLGVAVAPVTGPQAEAAAALWRRGSGLSLADRLCLALGTELGAAVLTADRAWLDAPGVQLIR